MKTAFLNGIVKNDIYLEQPKGIQQVEGMVCKLNKALYGLKQSPRLWNERFNNFVINCGFRRSEADYCLYLKGNDY